MNIEPQTWVLLGIGFLLAEAFWPKFAAVFCGFAALAVGASLLAGAALPPGVDWAIFVLLSTGSILLFRRSLLARFCR